MPKYLTVPFETDPEDLLNDAVAFLQDKIDGWEPADGNLEYWLMQAIASEAAELMDIASAVPTAIFRVFGADLMGLPPVDETSAFTYTTWTMIDNQGYTIPAGTQVGLQASGDVTVAFETVNEVVVPPGSTVTAAGAILITAIEPGVAASGLGSVGGTVQLIDPLAFVNGIVMTQATTGGVDEEADDVYLDRLATKLRTMTPRPILPNDFAILARDVAGVYRAVAIDLYNPATNTFNNERMVTVAAIDSAGVDVGISVKNAVQAYLDAMREVNFIVNVMDPKHTTIDVGFSISVLPGFDPNLTVDNCEVAVANYLSHLEWGREPTIDPDQFTWVDDNVVRYNEVIAVIDRQEGVRYVSAVTVNGGTANVNLSAPASLPDAGTISGTYV